MTPSTLLFTQPPACWVIPLVFTVPPVRKGSSWLVIGAGNFVFRKSNTTSTDFWAFSWVIPVLFTIRFITCSFMVNSRPAHDELRAGCCQKQPAYCSPPRPSLLVTGDTSLACHAIVPRPRDDGESLLHSASQYFRVSAFRRDV